MADKRRSGPEGRDTAPEEAGATQAPSAPEPARDVTSDEIALRAYELYEERGGEHGRDWDDWLEAEYELRVRRRTPGPTPS